MQAFPFGCQHQYRMNAFALHWNDMRWLLHGGVAALAALMACVNFEAQQRKWILQTGGPRTNQASATPRGLPDQWIEFDSQDTGAPVRLHGLWLAQPQADAPVLLYLHGARWGLCGSFKRMQHLHALGFAVLGIDYRGFGHSTAALPSERTACEDAHAAWRWLAQRHLHVDPRALRHPQVGLAATGFIDRAALRL